MTDLRTTYCYRHCGFHRPGLCCKSRFPDAVYKPSRSRQRTFLNRLKLLRVREVAWPLVRALSTEKGTRLPRFADLCFYG